MAGPEAGSDPRGEAGAEEAGREGTGRGLGAAGPGGGRTGVAVGVAGPPGCRWARRGPAAGRAGPGRAWAWGLTEVWRQRGAPLSCVAAGTGGGWCPPLEGYGFRRVMPSVIARFFRCVYKHFRYLFAVLGVFRVISSSFLKI